VQKRIDGDRVAGVNYAFYQVTSLYLLLLLLFLPTTTKPVGVNIK